MARWKRDYEGERYTVFLGLKLKPSQMEKLAREAGAHGMSVSAFARAVLAQERLPACDPAVLRELAGQIRAVGNNYNQMVKLAHQSGRVRVTEEFRDVEQSVIAALGKIISL